MKVMCIMESETTCPLSALLGIKPIIHIGGVYMVIDEVQDEEGLYYELQEHRHFIYWSGLFAPLSEIDENELVNEQEEVFS